MQWALLSLHYYVCQLFCSLEGSFNKKLAFLKAKRKNLNISVFSVKKTDIKDIKALFSALLFYL